MHGSPVSAVSHLPIQGGALVRRGAESATPQATSLPVRVPTVVSFCKKSVDELSLVAGK
jgi:hypothetical protein